MATLHCLKHDRGYQTPSLPKGAGKQFGEGVNSFASENKLPKTLS